jgi:hypothetical protein
MEPEVRFTDAQRRAVGEALEPYLANADDLTPALRAIETLTARYLGDLDSGIYALDPPRRGTLDELERLRSAADALSKVLRTLSEPTRDRLTEWVHHAPPPDEPESMGPLAPLVPREMLERCAREAGFIAGRAAMLHIKVAREVRPPGRPPDWAARDFVAGLATVWEGYTGRTLPRGNPNRAPWGAFVAAAMQAVGVDGDPYYLARSVAEARQAEKTSAK